MEREPRFAERDDGGRRTVDNGGERVLKRVSREINSTDSNCYMKRETLLILIFNF